VTNETVTEGEFVTSDDLLARSAVAVIGPDTADKLFGSKEGVTGETVRIAGQPFRVIGVLKSKGGSGFGNQDDRIIIPLTTAQSRLFQRNIRDSVDNIQAEAVDSESVTSATEEISQILRTRHRTEVGVDDFTLFTQSSILSTAQSITGVLTLFLGGIAAISLLVGGIGIMNIMLVSVTERTREIGLRKAIGARKRYILIQFLTESILLSLLGGFIGILLAWLITLAIQAVAAASGTPLEPSISLSAILLATLFSSAVGLLFGLYPANRAASLQPVEALRYE
jgi:putative ABC transport system permease protein